MKMRAGNSFKIMLERKDAGKHLVVRRCIGAIFLILTAKAGFSQDGSAGITAATTNLVTYFAVGVTLMYAIGAVLGLVGAIKVYQKWSHGDHDTSKVAASWFGSCIFLVIVATVLKSFFGV
jgi:hypothetical protein